MRTRPQIVICLCVIAIIIIGFGGMKKKIAMTMIQLKVTRMLGLIEHLIHPIPIEVSISTMASKKKRKFFLRSQSQTGHRNDLVEEIKAKRLSLVVRTEIGTICFLNGFTPLSTDLKINKKFAYFYVYVRVAETLLMETFPGLSPQAKKKGRIESFLDPRGSRGFFLIPWSINDISFLNYKLHSRRNVNFNDISFLSMIRRNAKNVIGN